jgi:protein-S-isoprenylcysteine O-methyltransferase Ste14
VAAVVFVVVIPVSILHLSAAIDAWLGARGFQLGIANRLVGGLVGLVGLSTALWTVFAQLARGRGTPLPVLPPRTLLADGPFAYCRNPMALGTLIYYSGISVWMGSYSMLALVVVFAALLLSYIKRVEEPQLELRFGQAYLDYRDRTPFLIPSFPKGT